MPEAFGHVYALVNNLRMKKKGDHRGTLQVMEIQYLAGVGVEGPKTASPRFLYCIWALVTNPEQSTLGQQDEMCFFTSFFFHFFVDADPAPTTDQSSIFFFFWFQVLYLKKKVSFRFVRLESHLAMTESKVSPTCEPATEDFYQSHHAESPIIQ